MFNKILIMVEYFYALKNMTEVKHIVRHEQLFPFSCPLKHSEGQNMNAV